MNTAELKSNLHQLIVETNDVTVLKQIQDYFKELTFKKSDWMDEVSNEAKRAINKGLNQLDNGEGIPNDEVDRQISELFLVRNSDR